MERLTMKSDKGGLAFTFDLDITCEKSEIEKILKLGEKLAAYEDTSLTPEQIKEIDKLHQEKCEEVNRLKAEYPIGLEMAEIYASLSRYKQAKEQGRLIELPCEVGDIVYKVSLNDVKEYKVFAINIGIRENASSCVILTKNNRGAVIDFETIDFGKTAFLTREEAEAKLAEMEGMDE